MSGATALDPRQTSFVPAPHVMIEFDPGSFAYGAPVDDETGYEEWGLYWGLFTAWHLDLPSVTGQGNSEHWALVDLARQLRAWSWPTEHTMTGDAQLAYAAERLSLPDLVAYLHGIASPAELSDGYGLVLR